MQKKNSRIQAKTHPQIRLAFKGFTLLEIVIAIFIFAIVMTTLLGSFRAVFSSTKAVDSRAAIFDTARNCLNRMVLDLKSLYVSQPPIFRVADIDDPPDPHRIEGRAADAFDTDYPKLRFTSLAHVGFEKDIRKGIAEIVYYVAQTEDNRHVLRRKDSLYPYPEFEESGLDPILCDAIVALEFTYYDTEGTEFNEWDSESEEFGYATPNAIGIRIKIGDLSDAEEFETRIVLPTFRAENDGET